MSVTTINIFEDLCEVLERCVVRGYAVTRITHEGLMSQYDYEGRGYGKRYRWIARRYWPRLYFGYTLNDLRATQLERLAW